MTNGRPGPTVIGRYVLHAPIARGGMATIHLARLLGAQGFSRMVAAKRLHPQFTDDTSFVQMFLDEARVASKIHHPNVVPVLDVVHAGTEVILVQEYVHGIPLDKLLRAAGQAQQDLPVGVVVAVVADVLAGLAAAHDARDELGAPIGIVHRDVSPQNVLVGVDGISRLLDFGVAKASLNVHHTRVGVFKGKVAYTSPEQLRGTATPASDIYAVAVVLWEALASRRLYQGLRDKELMEAVLRGAAQSLTQTVEEASVSAERWKALRLLDPVVSRGLAFAPENRWENALQMQEALLEAVPAAQPAEVSRWVKTYGKEYLEGREALIVAEESTWRKRQNAVPGEDAARRSREPRLSLSLALLAAQGHRSRGEWAIAGGLLVVGVLLAAVLVVLLWPTHAPLTAVDSAVLPARTVAVEAASATAATPTVEPEPASSAVPAASAPSRSPSARPESSPPPHFERKKRVFMPERL